MSLCSCKVSGKEGVDGFFTPAQPSTSCPETRCVPWFFLKSLVSSRGPCLYSRRAQESQTTVKRMFKLFQFYRGGGKACLHEPQVGCGAEVTEKFHGFTVKSSWALFSLQQSTGEPTHPGLFLCVSQSVQRSSFVISQGSSDNWNVICKEFAAIIWRRWRSLKLAKFKHVSLLNFRVDCDHGKSGLLFWCLWWCAEL